MTQYGIVCMCMVRRCVVSGLMLRGFRQRAKHMLAGEGIFLRRADKFVSGEVCFLRVVGEGWGGTGALRSLPTRI